MNYLKCIFFIIFLVIILILIDMIIVKLLELICRQNILNLPKIVLRKLIKSY